MNPVIETLLQPCSPEHPCGVYEPYDPRLDELETLLKGKPEIEHGSVKKEAEPPDWLQIKARCLEFLARSKHLRVATMLCCAQLRLEGFSGLRDGLQLVQGLLERYWPAVHPPLDPEDNNDPQERLSILSSLSPLDLGVLNPLTQSWLAIVDYLYITPMCRSQGAAPVTLEAIEAARKSTRKDAGGDEKPFAGPDLATLSSQFRGVDPNELMATQTALVEALKATQGTDAFLTETLGARGTISLENLKGTLNKLVAEITAFIPSGASGSETAPVSATPTGTAAVVETPSGSIRSRQDVVLWLDRLCEYYHKAEPGSPVPYLLRRAQRLATMSFIEAMQELNLATPEQLRPSMGSSVETPGSGTGA